MIKWSLIECLLMILIFESFLQVQELTKYVVFCLSFEFNALAINWKDVDFGPWDYLKTLDSKAVWKRILAGHCWLMLLSTSSDVEDVLPLLRSGDNHIFMNPLLFDMTTSLHDFKLSQSLCRSQSENLQSLFISLVVQILTVRRKEWIQIWEFIILNKMRGQFLIVFLITHQVLDLHPSINWR